MSFWNTLRISETALNAQRLRLDTISNNLANIETTHTVEGGPYQRKDVVFTPKGENQFLPTFIAARRNNSILNDPSLGGVNVASIVTDTSPGSRIYDPTHPDADKEGFVTYPNVNVITEMTNMLSATRSYEANLAAVDASKRMALRALEIGR